MVPTNREHCGTDKITLYEMGKPFYKKLKEEKTL